MYTQNKGELMKQSAILSLMLSVYGMSAIEIVDFSIEDIGSNASKYVRIVAHMDDGSERATRIPRDGMSQDWVLDLALDKLLEDQ